MRRFWRLIPLLYFSACAASSQRTLAPHTSHPEAGLAAGTIVGELFDYTIRRGDTLSGIGARYGVDVGTLASRNGITARSRLRPGQVLRVDNRHIVPRMLDDGIVINIPQRLLFHFEGGRLVGWYPAAVGQPGSWGTPTGSYEVATRERNPVWDVPVSIQREMRRKGERVRTRVPPGPDNPLGKYWLGLSLPCCGIHGTNAPESIYTFQTHGCIRLAPNHAEELFSRVAVGTPVEIVYEPVLAARDRSGEVFVEVHPDVYGRGGRVQFERLAAAARAKGLEPALEGYRWEEIVRREEGIAVRLSSPDAGVAAGGAE